MGNQIMTDENRKQYLLLAILYLFLAFFDFLKSVSEFVFGMLIGLKCEISAMSLVPNIFTVSTYISCILGIIITFLTIKFFHRQYDFRKLDVWLYSLIVLNIIKLGMTPFFNFYDSDINRTEQIISIISCLLAGFVVIMLGISLNKIQARLYGYKSLLVYTSIISGVLYATFCLAIFGILANFVNNIAFGLMFWAASKGPDTLIEDNPPQVEAVTPQ